MIRIQRDRPAARFKLHLRPGFLQRFFRIILVIRINRTKGDIQIPRDKITSVIPIFVPCCIVHIFITVIESTDCLKKQPVIHKIG